LYKELNTLPQFINWVDFRLPANNIPITIKNNCGLYYIRKKIMGPPEWSDSNKNIEPCILTETYYHQNSKRYIEINYRRGYGFSAFRKNNNSIGIFFYRGDSLGEGGSGNLWMSRNHLSEICYKLIDGGLIITDGSNHGWKKFSFKPIWYYTYKDFVNPKKFVDSIPFIGPNGNYFKCIGVIYRKMEIS